MQVVSPVQGGGQFDQQIQALMECQKQLMIDPQAFVGVLPLVLSQVAIPDVEFRIQLLKLLAMVFDKADTLSSDFRFAGVIG